MATPRLSAALRAWTRKRRQWKPANPQQCEWSPCRKRWDRLHHKAETICAKEIVREPAATGLFKAIEKSLVPLTTSRSSQKNG
jgi:hypothetical protein